MFVRTFPDGHIAVRVGSTIFKGRPVQPAAASA
jgi:hypothetical protein